METYKTYGKGRKSTARYSSVEEMAEKIGLKFKENKMLYVNRDVMRGIPGYYDIYEDASKNLYIADVSDLYYDNPHVNGTSVAVHGECYFKKLIEKQFTK